jgi:hypothetical protein
MNTKNMQKTHQPGFFRQGDVKFIPVKGKVDLGKRIRDKNGQYILAYGERSGHKHVIGAANTTLYEKRPCVDLEARPAAFVAVVAAPDHALHTKHPGIEVAPGTYWVVPEIREYDGKEERRARD